MASEAPPTGERRPRSRLAIAALGLIAVIGLVDAVTSNVVLAPLLLVAPLLVAVQGKPRQTAVVAAVATVVAALDGLISDDLGTKNRLVAVGAVAAGGALAVVAARHGVALAQERRARRRSELLARAGDLVGSEPDPRTMLDRLAALPVPELADLAIIDLLQPEGTLHGAVIHAKDAELAEALSALRARLPLNAQGAHPAAIALREGKAQLVPRMTDEDLHRIATNDEHYALIARAQYRSAVAVPLTARGRTTGVLSLLRCGDDAEPFDDEDLQMGVDLARRAALAVDNARLLDELTTTDRRLQAIVAHLGEAVTALAPDGSIIFTNRTAAEFAGLPTPEALIASDVGALLHEWVALDEHGNEVPFDQQPAGIALAGGEPEPMLLRMVHRVTGRDLWLLTRAAVVRDEAGRLQFVVHVSEDVGTVKRQERRERLLSIASKLLGSSLDVQTTLDKAAWAVVPELADWARVDLPDERGLPRQVAVAHRDLEKIELLNEWRRDYPPDPANDRGPSEVLRTGRSLIWREVQPGDIERYAQSARHAELMRSIDTQSILIVPMRAGDRVIGTMQLATTSESARRLGDEQLELAEELANRAAIAVENARVHAARTHIASTLQRSLLPPRLPVIPGLSIAALFRAAGTAAEVGGDFYDLFEAGDRWMVMIGDVTGKGPGAAAITSLARYTMRTAAHYEHDTTAMLGRLNATLGSDPERRQICTAVCVAVTPPGPAHPAARLEIVCAGHPAPLLRSADGEVRAVGPPGTLLGAFPEGRWRRAEVDLEAGETLVLYTDGVTDTRGPEGRFGTDRLEALLRDLGPAEPDATAERIDDALRAFGEQRDDVALLILQVTPAAGDAAVTERAA